ncbi:hypothetical protein [Cystovirus CAP4]|nr:hypothetical protein [Cystovirus CAP4]
MRISMKVSKSLSSGMPEFKPRVGATLWNTIRLLSRIGIIADADTLGVMKGQVNGVSVRHAPLGVELTVETRQLYETIVAKLEAEGLSFDSELVIKIERT